MTEDRPGRWDESDRPLIDGWDLAVSEAPRGESLNGPADRDLSFRIAEPAPPDAPPGPVFQSTRTLVPRPDPARSGLAFPREGQVLGGFRIVGELGRGAFARVYLAEQVELGGRKVALKIAEALGDEPQALARLQHAHIVPIHSIHDDPATGFRLLCMPFVGGANLAQILAEAGARSPTLDQGRSLVEALDLLNAGPATRKGVESPSCVGDSTTNLTKPADGLAREERSPSLVRSLLGRYWVRLPWGSQLEPAGPGQEAVEERNRPARRYLQSHSYVQAAAWITARLAEGLEHAHERGILHRDLKPSNILIAADGTPMLLDFNLAAEADDRQERGDRARLGGTLPYMAPEHLDAFNPMGTTSPEAVDRRSDLYSLGLILWEILGGHHPFDDPPVGNRLIEAVTFMTAERRRGAPSVRESNPMVPPSLDAILAKSLAPEPARRYSRASEFAEDLNRFLDDLPNRFAPEPSPKERLAKWWKRHPQFRGAGPVAATAAFLLLLVGMVSMAVFEGAQTVKARLVRAHFRDNFARCQLLLNTASGPSSHLGRGLEEAERALAPYRVLSDSKWSRAAMVRLLPAEEQTALREEVSELLLLTTRARVASARSRSEPVRRKALLEAVARLSLAERIDPRPSAALFEDRARYLAALGEARQARADRDRASQIPLTSARDYYLAGMAHAGSGAIDQAEAELSRAIAIDPQRFWAWFVLGTCHFDAGRFEAAAGDFSACTLLAPDFAWPHLNRGLALASAGHLASARAEYDRALALSPDFVEALVNRALVCLQSDDPTQAEADLRRAQHLGRREAPLLAARAEALSRLGRRDQAEAEFAEALKIRPDDPAILVARGFSRLTVDPAGSASDFGRVLDRNPRHARASLGMARLRAQDRPEALRLVDSALDADPTLGDARQFRALLRARSGLRSAVADVDLLVATPSPHSFYNASCALAVLAEKTGDSSYLARAVGLLRRAIVLGFPREIASRDPDLLPLRNRPEFRAIVGEGD